MQSRSKFCADCATQSTRGGGIWSVIFKSDANGKFQLHRFALVGVNFWETGLENGQQKIRGHFVRSIYGHTLKPPHA